MFYRKQYPIAESFCLSARISEIFLFTGKLNHKITNKSYIFVKLCTIFIVFSILQFCVSPDEDGYDGDSQSPKKINIETDTLKNAITKPIQVLNVTGDGQKQQVQSLVFSDNLLIVGTNMGIISGYTWCKNRLTKKVWETFVANQNIADQNDMNCFWLSKHDKTLYAGCGDNNIYAFGLEVGKVTRKFTGHQDYVHWIDGSEGAHLYSASEDGSIKFWDHRGKRSVNQLEPHKDDRLERGQFGKWQGTVSVTDDWLLCGGGPKACIYHLRSLDCSTIVDFNSAIHVSGFYDDIVYVGGDDNHLCQYNLKGNTMAEIPVSSSSIYSVVTQTVPEKFMSIAGSSNYLDICTNFNYKDIMLKLYEAPKTT